MVSKSLFPDWFRYDGGVVGRARQRKQLTCIDLFAGCGGLSLGLEEAGFVPLMYCEINKSARATYEANRRESPPVPFGDIYAATDDVLDQLLSRWRSDGLKTIDLVAGGPPCQGYSGIGHRRTFKLRKEQIPSNYLYHEMVRVIRKIRPRTFLFENVAGLLSSKWTPDGEKGEIWRDVQRAFRELQDMGYSVEHGLIHAKQHGVPQNRPRVMIVGICKEVGWRPDHSDGAIARGLLPRPNGAPPNLTEVLCDLIDDDYLGKRRTERYPRAVRTGSFQEEMRRSRDGKRVARKGDPVTEHEYSQHTQFIRSKFQYMLRHNGDIAAQYRTKKFAQKVLPSEWPDGGPNITATSLPDDYVHFEQPRTLTVREWARLQCFPDWYVFEGPRTTGGRRRAGDPSAGIWDREVPKYTQIGNAVPVWLARAVGRHLANMLQ